MSDKTSPRRAAAQTARRLIKAPNYYMVSRGDICITNADYAGYGRGVPLSRRPSA